MTRWILLADDFTGAMDAAVPFAQAGKRVWVTPRSPFTAGASLPEVVSLDLETRHLSGREAEAAVRQAVLAARAYGRIYLKIDSTLRGPVGSYLEGALSACPDNGLLLAPAYPQAGRTLREGILYVYGVPVAESAFGSDPFEPVCQSRVAELIRRGLTRPVHEDAVGAQSGPCVTVANAETDGELDRLAVRLEHGRELACGSAGLTSALARLYAPPVSPPLPQGPGGGFLLVCGSLHETSRRQLAVAEQAGMPCLTLPLEAFCMDEGIAATAASALQARALACLREKSAVILTTPPPERAGVAQGRLTAQRMAALAAAILHAGQVQTLAIFGGDTLRALMAALRCHTLEPKAQLSPGVVLAHMADGDYPGWVVTKAGGFGGDGLVHELYAWHGGAKAMTQGGNHHGEHL